MAGVGWNIVKGSTVAGLQRCATAQRSWAKTFGMKDVAKLLQANLDQEIAADHKLTKLAQGSLNEKAVA